MDSMDGVYIAVSVVGTIHVRDDETSRKRYKIIENTYLIIDNGDSILSPLFFT